MASAYEKVLAAELLATMTVETLDSFSGVVADDAGNVTGKVLVDPARYTATVMVFLMLAGAAMFGERIAKLAAQFGGVATLAIIMAPGQGGEKPPIMGALNWFNKMITGGSVGLPNPSPVVSSQGGTTPSSTPAGVAPANTYPTGGGATPIVTPLPGNAFPPAA